MRGKKAARLFFKEYIIIEVRNYHLEKREKESIQSNIRDTKRSRTGRKVNVCIDQLQGYSKEISQVKRNELDI